MNYHISASCVSQPGRVRQNNEDNFVFSGACKLPEDAGTASVLLSEADSDAGVYFAVYDGMGGENFGEIASYVAAKESAGIQPFSTDPLQELEKLALRLNHAVVTEAERQLTSHMGSTMVALYFHKDKAYLCNVGDSRAYRIRNGAITRLSEDHVENLSSIGVQVRRKPSLSQYLGVDPEEFEIEPTLRAEVLQNNDRFVLCSDGLTDMVPKEEINKIVTAADSAETAVQALLHAALTNGGRDNITIITCFLSQQE